MHTPRTYIRTQTRRRHQHIFFLSSQNSGDTDYLRTAHGADDCSISPRGPTQLRVVESASDSDLFKALTDKGVEIKILTNSLASNDNLEAFNGYQRDRQKLLKTGVEIYEFKPDAEIRQKIMSEVMDKQLTTPPIFGLHSKSMVIDDEITVIGTFNLDPRSANLNTESITVIPSKALTLDVKQGMLEEMEPQNAWQTTVDWNPDGEVDLLKQIRVKLRRVVPKNIL